MIKTRTACGGSATERTPHRRAKSVRRTTSHITTRPSGLDGPAVLAASGRDLRTTHDVRAEVLALAWLDATVDYLSGRLLAISMAPSEPRLDALQGLSVFTGFRGAVLKVLPGEAHSLRYQLLDDVPVAIMANGRSLRAEGRPVTTKIGRKPPVDLCAGYAADSVAIAGFSDMGSPLAIGPLAPDLAKGDDAIAWPESAPLSPYATARIRRIDVWQDGVSAYADCFFRDSHVDRYGRHTVVHEWSILAEIDPERRRFLQITTRAGPLPYPECPSSAASAQRLVGLPVDGTRQHVRSTFNGPQTCSHLNDSLRAMEDVGALLDLSESDGRP